MTLSGNFPYVLSIGDDGYITSSSGNSFGLLKTEQLEALKNAILKTSEFYEYSGYTNKEIIRINESLNQNDSVSKRFELLDKENKSSIYLISDYTKSFIKIGSSSNVKARLKQLNTASPVKLVLVFEGTGLGKNERSYHEMFHDLRLNSEWFNYDQKIIDYFNSL